MDQKLRDEITILHAQVCKGLADPNRILILYTLAERSYTVNDMVDLLNLPQSNISRHLKILRERGMVTALRDGQSVNYSLHDPRIIEALDILRRVMTDNLQSQIELVSASY